MTKTLLPGLILALAVALNQLRTPETPPSLIASSSSPLISLKSASSHPVVFAGEPQEIYLYLALAASELERPEVERPSMNLSLVIDRSGSMGSEDKLMFAKSAAEQLVGRLRADDHLAICVYDDTVQTIVASAPASERELFLTAIREIKNGRATNLYGGMMAGYEEVLIHYDPKRSNRVLLLSDGLANAGVIEPLEIQSRAKQCRERGVRISTMGMGLSYDEDLMSAIALNSGGNYYYVGEAETVGRHLDREIDELSEVVVRDVTMRLTLEPGVEFMEAYGYSHRIEGQTVSLPISDMIANERKKVLVRLRVKGDAGQRSEFATAELDFVDATSHEAGRIRNESLVHQFTDDIQQVESAKRMDVMIKVEVVRNAESIMAAMDLQKAGRIDEAREHLEARYRNCKLMNDTEYLSAELTVMLQKMLSILNDLERTRAIPTARRDLQLFSELRALGYMGDD